MSNNAVFPEENPPEVEHYHTKHSPARDKKPNLSPTLRSPNVYDRFVKEEVPEYQQQGVRRKRAIAGPTERIVRDQLDGISMMVKGP